MVQLDQQLGRRPVGQVAARARDPALHHRRVAAGPEQHLVVVRLEHERGEVRAADSARPPSAGPGRTPRRRRCRRPFAPRAPAARPRRGSWGRPRSGTAPARRVRAEPDAAGARRHPCRGTSRPQVPGAVSTGTPRRRASRGGAAGVVAVLVRQRDRRRRRSRSSPTAGRAALDLPRAEAGVEQEHRAVRFDGEAVAPGARAQHEESHHRAVPRAIGPLERRGAAPASAPRPGAASPARRRGGSRPR